MMGEKKEISENDKLKFQFENLKKYFEELKKEMKKGFDKAFINNKSDLYNYLAREIKNECDIQTLLDFLYDKKIINRKEFSEHRGKSRLFQSFKDENNNVYKFSKYFKDIENNFNLDALENPSKFVSVTNLFFQKDRFLYKREKMLNEGYKEDSEEIKIIDEHIKEFDELIKKTGDFDKKKIKSEDYFLKKEEAENIYASFSEKKEEILERIRELPLVENKFHLEPENKSLYYESISNYWFGNFNASICMLSIFIESFLKEIWYYKKRKHYEGELSDLINDCRTEEYISEQEKNYLHQLREFIRNNYIHSNWHKLISEVVIPVYLVDLTGKEKPKPTYVTAEKLPTLRSIVKTDIDKERARKLIIEIVKIVEEITTRNYEFQQKKEDKK
jgi:hypothetical protein